ncbi:hypothetical protein QBC40DRAFT_294469 [Triangularia verruculosa]|uniref:Uncharacterized protein n=1 Tax=Triangularia verruculosa TaxID=2587418 RepID=A0AAN6XL90_9PEZI|nr:hypothetical protein QBC40DRAFT_294469 [Triangularia verruculosa]
MVTSGLGAWAPQPAASNSLARRPRSSMPVFVRAVIGSPLFEIESKPCPSTERGVARQATHFPGGQEKRSRYEDLDIPHNRFGRQIQIQPADDHLCQARLADRYDLMSLFEQAVCRWHSQNDAYETTTERTQLRGVSAVQPACVFDSSARSGLLTHVTLAHLSFPFSSSLLLSMQCPTIKKKQRRSQPTALSFSILGKRARDVKCLERGGGVFIFTSSSSQ